MTNEPTTSSPASTVPVSTFHLLTIGHLVFALAVLVVVSYEWSRSHTDLQQVSESIKTIEQTHKGELDTLHTEIAALEKEKKNVTTPAQIIHELPQYITLPQPITIPSTSGPANATGGPNAPVVASLPLPDLQPIFDLAVAEKECTLQRVDDSTRIEELTKERDEAVKAAKPRGFWKNLGHDAKIVGIGVGIGIAIGAKL